MNTLANPDRPSSRPADTNTGQAPSDPSSTAPPPPPEREPPERTNPPRNTRPQPPLPPWRR